MNRLKRYRILCNLFLALFAVNTAQSQISAHPNPFSEKTVLCFTVPAADTVTIHVIDIVGKIIDTMYSAMSFPAGNYSDTLNMTGEPDGLYFVAKQTATSKDIIKVIKSKGVSLEEHLYAQLVTIAPNPSSAGDVVKILVGNQGVQLEDVRLTDITGRLIRNLGTTIGAPLEIAHLEAGIYLLRMTVNGEPRSNKLIRY